MDSRGRDDRRSSGRGWRWSSSRWSGASARGLQRTSEWGCKSAAGGQTPHSGLDALTSRSTLLEPRLPGLGGGGPYALPPGLAPEGPDLIQIQPVLGVRQRPRPQSLKVFRVCSSLMRTTRPISAPLGGGGWGGLGLQTNPDSHAPPEPGDRRRAAPRPWNHQGHAAPVIDRPSAGRCHGDLSQRPVTVIQEPV